MSTPVTPFSQRPQGDVICLFGESLQLSLPLEPLFDLIDEINSTLFLIETDVDGTLTPARRVSYTRTIRLHAFEC